MSEAREAATVRATPAEGEARAFVAAMEARADPLMRDTGIHSWEAAIGGGEEALERASAARAALSMLFSDPEGARRVRGWLEGGQVHDALLRRRLELLDHEYTRSQLTPDTIRDLVRRAAELEHVFHTFRSTFRGDRLSNNELLEAFQASASSELRREAWEASKEIGPEVAGPLRELVRRRNAAARSLGFSTYYAMELHLQELGEDRLFAVLDEFRDRTDEPFRHFRGEMDARLAERFGVSPGELRPWHWDDFFAQEAPAISGTVELDAWFRERDLEATARDFFRGIGLEVDDVLARSDLHEREGKDQHAFCVDVDRRGDVRVLCNLRPNEKWMGTLLHELGHAAYDKYIPAELPFMLRTIAHTLSTEAIAMYMGRLTRDPAWLRDVAGAQLDPAQAADIRAQQRAAMLVSARWILVMAYFERELYRNPDRDDLNSLWWELVERLQYIRRPDGRDAPDWAAKIHLSLSPVYYHNYLLGELMASQVSAHARRGVPEGKSIAGEPGVGAFLREKIFALGATLDWNQLLVHATGEELSPRYFVDEFVGA
jgi:peptidyl-dipeptidase A